MSASRNIFKKCTKYFNWAQMSSNLPEWDLQIYPRLVMCWYEEIERAKSDISSLGVWLSNLFRVLSLRELLGLRRWEEKLYTNQRKLSRSALPQIDLEVGDYASMSVRFFLINVSNHSVEIFEISQSSAVSVWGARLGNLFFLSFLIGLVSTAVSFMWQKALQSHCKMEKTSSSWNLE